jgi:fatty-acyl-CoA synthase
MTRSARPAAPERRLAVEARHPEWVRRTTAGLLDVMAERHPHRPFLLTDGPPVTYAETVAWSKRLAAGLTNLGVRPGDHVAVDITNMPEVVALRFALARLGAVAVSVNVQLRRDELCYVLRQSDARLLVTMDRFRDLDYLAELDGIIPGWDRRPEGRAGGDYLPQLRDVVVLDIEGSEDRGIPFARLDSSVREDPVRDETAAPDADDPGAVSDILYTSGTTGEAKGVQLTHDALLRTAYSSALTRAFDDGWRLLFALPLHHVFGYVEGLLAALFVGGAVRLHPIFDPARMLTDVDRHRIDELICVPSMTSELVALARSGHHDLSSLRTMFSSGGPHRASSWTEMVEVLGVDEVFTAYGQTETTASTVCTRPGDPLDRLVHTLGAPKPAGVAGDPELGGLLAEYAVLDPVTCARLPAGETGELVVRGAAVTPGYYAKPAETAAAFTADGWLRTGDLGLIDDQGYLVLTGRCKDTYRRGGELVMPAEVEHVLASHPGVADAHVVGIPDERMGEVGCAWVVLDEGRTPPPTAEDLLHHCRERLARFKVPAMILFCGPHDVPRTSIGKVRKHLLAQHASARARGRRSPSDGRRASSPDRDGRAGPAAVPQPNRSRSARFSTLP